MTDSKVFNYELDGLKFSVTVFEEGGVFKATINVEEGYADFNAIYWGDDVAGNSDFDGFGGRDKSLNMNGAEGSTFEGEAVEWDGAEKLSSAGLGKEGEDKQTFLQEGESVTLTLDGLSSLDQIDFLGIRATSTSTPEGSIKTIAVPEEPVDPEEPKDDFPEWPQDISNVVLVFDQKDGDTKPTPDGDGFYTVKIDNWPNEGDDDLDNSIDDILAYLVANDEFITADSDLLGVVIKGGNQAATEFFAFGDNNTNGTEADDLPEGIGFALPDENVPGGGTSANVQPTNAIDKTYLYTDVFGLTDVPETTDVFDFV
ncbi:hypothetical protein ACSSV8_000425 [Roseovarius sp. MBR-79]|jgi:hypothetical protein